MGWLVLCAGCGRIGFAPAATSDAATGTDADAIARSWGAGVVVAPLQSNESTSDPTVTSDGLEMLMIRRSNSAVEGRVLRSTRATTFTEWGVPVDVAELESPRDEAGPQLSRDGLSVYIASERNGGSGSHDVWSAARASLASAWTTPVRVIELSTAGDEGSPGIDGAELHLVSSMNVGSFDLGTSSRASTAAPWSTPVLTPELNTDSSETTPCLDPSGLVVYFGSDRAGSFDLYVATRPTLTSPFGAPQAIVELNTPARESDAWITSDGTQLYYERDAAGRTDIFVSTLQ